LAFNYGLIFQKKNKLVEPQYQEYSSEKIPIYTDPDTKSTVKVISGSYKDIEGPCLSKTPSVYYDVGLNEQSEINLPIGDDKNGYLFVYKGSIKINDKEIKINYAGMFKSGNGNVLNVKCDKGSSGKFLLMAAKPLNEPVKQYGPFVMNTEKELNQALEDYQGSKNGFEGADKWKSEIRNLKNKKI